MNSVYYESVDIFIIVNKNRTYYNYDEGLVETCNHWLQKGSIIIYL